MRTVADAVRGELVERSEGREVADVVAEEAHSLESVGQLEQRGALVHLDRRMELERHPAGRTDNPDRAAICCANASTSDRSSGLPR